MTPGDLQSLLHAIDPDLCALDPAETLATLEARPQRAWGPVYVRALERVEEWATAGEVRLVDGLQRETLVCWDRFSATWIMRDRTGQRLLVRGVRPGAPAPLARQLERDQHALHGLVDGLRFEHGCLMAPAPGGTLHDASLTAPMVPSLLAEALAIASDWAHAGIGPGWAPESIRLADGHLQVVSLTPGSQESGTTGFLSQVVARLPALGDGPLGRFARGLQTWSLEGDQSSELNRALAAELKETLASLRQRHLATKQGSRRSRLQTAVGALIAAMPPPSGTGSVGFDLDGNPTEVHSDGRSVRWGVDRETRIFGDLEFDAPAARRFLRACAAAPSQNAAPFTESMGRWVAAGLRLRTLRLLLEKS